MTDIVYKQDLHQNDFLNRKKGQELSIADRVFTLQKFISARYIAYQTQQHRFEHSLTKTTTRPSFKLLLEAQQLLFKIDLGDYNIAMKEYTRHKVLVNRAEGVRDAASVKRIQSLAKYDRVTNDLNTLAGGTAEETRMIINEELCAAAANAYNIAKAEKDVSIMMHRQAQTVYLHTLKNMKEQMDAMEKFKVDLQKQMDHIEHMLTEVEAIRNVEERSFASMTSYSRYNEEDDRIGIVSEDDSISCSRSRTSSMPETPDRFFHSFPFCQCTVSEENDDESTIYSDSTDGEYISEKENSDELKEIYTQKKTVSFIERSLFEEEMDEYDDDDACTSYDESEDDESVDSSDDRGAVNYVGTENDVEVTFEDLNNSLTEEVGIEMKSSDAQPYVKCIGPSETVPSASLHDHTLISKQTNIPVSTNVTPASSKSPAKKRREKLDWRLPKEESLSDWIIRVKVLNTDEVIHNETERDREYHVHKIIMTCSSRSTGNIFNEIFEKNRNGVTIELRDSAAEAFPIMLDYIYSNDIAVSENVNSKTGVALRYLSKRYDLPGLQKIVTDFIKNDFCFETSVDYLIEAVKFDEEKLVKASTNLCAAHFNSLQNLERVPSYLIGKIVASPKFHADSQKYSVQIANVLRFQEVTPELIHLMTSNEKMPMIHSDEAEFYLSICAKLDCHNDTNKDDTTTLYQRSIKSISNNWRGTVVNGMKTDNIWFKNLPESIQIDIMKELLIQANKAQT